MADNIRATPQSPTLGALAAALRRAQQFAGQYQVDPRVPLLGGTSVDELLSLPGAASLMEDVSYNGPRALIRGGNAATGGIGTFRLDPRVTDLADVALNVSPLGAVAAKAAGRGTMALGRAGERLAERAVPAIMDRGGMGAQMLQALGTGTTSNVVKPKGGNWLQGGVEHSLRQLQRGQEPVLSGEIVNDAAGRDIFSEYRQAYDQNPELSLYAWTRKNYPEVYASLQEPEERAVSRWIDTKLGKYIRNEMATPQDPVRALAERGVLHVPPEQLNYRLSAYGKYPLPNQEFTATSDAAKMWEGASDNAINIAQPQDYLKYSGDTAHRQTIAENPWLKTVPEDTKVYSPAESEMLASDLGFDHLIDELKFSMSPDSGLPDALRFDPKDVDKITVPQAVERVSKINAWRAEQAAEAEKAGMLENLKAAPRAPAEELQLSFVDKPGGAWVDIPDTVNDKGMPVCNSIGKAGGWCTQHEWAGERYGSGNNRLTTLLDTEGRPHAQAKITQVGGTDDIMDDIDDVMQELTPAQRKKFNNYLGSDDYYGDFDEALSWLQENIPAAHAKFLQSRKGEPPSITELKPVGNEFSSDRAKEYIRRDPDYKAKVTDSVLKFLNNGEWGDVKDLHHYDIIDLQRDPTMLLAYLRDITGQDSRGAQALFNQAVDANPNAPRFMTPRQLREFLSGAEQQGYAGGGIVKGAVKGLGEMVEKYLAKEAPQAAAPTEHKMLQGFYRGYAGDYDAARAAEDAGKVFVTPQRAAGEFYANKRAMQTGLDPHLEMILADPFAGFAYGHAIPTGPSNRKVDFTKARQLQPAEVRDRTPLFAEGGEVSVDQQGVNRMVDAENAADGGLMSYAAGGLVNYDPNEIDTIVSQLKEEFHA